MPVNLDIRQSQLNTALPMVGTISGATVDQILPVLDSEMGKLYEDRNGQLSDGGLITFTGTEVTFTEPLNFILNQRTTGALPTTFQLTSGPISLSNGDTFIATINRTANSVTTSTVPSGTALPAANSTNQDVFVIIRRIDSVDGTQTVYFRNGMSLITAQSARLGSPGAGSSGGGAPVGALQSAFLTLAQFQAQAGAGWILADGSSVPGSSYEAVTGSASLIMSANATASATIPLTFSTIVTNNSNTILSSGSSIISDISLTSLALIAPGQLINTASSTTQGTTVSSMGAYTFTVSATGNYTFTVSTIGTYTFTVSIASATTGAVYTDTVSGNTYTVTSTIAGATTLVTTGTATSSASGTLTLTSGVGDATITFSSVAIPSATATAGSVYTDGGNSYTVVTTVTDSPTLLTSGTSDSAVPGTLTLSSGSGDSTIAFSAITQPSASATAGATYTNNGNTFTIVNTISDGFVFQATGTGLPTATGILTLATGTGDATIAFDLVSGSIVMSQNAISSSTTNAIFSTFVATVTGTTTSGSNTVTALSNTSSITAGASSLIAGVGIPFDTTITSVSSAKVPDARGLVLRGKNNGRSDGDQDPAGDLSLGTFESDTFASHNHVVGQFQLNMTTNTGTNSEFVMANGTNPSSVPANFTTTSSGSTETRVKAIVINHFIRIN